jgi:hypothetical protein
MFMADLLVDRIAGWSGRSIFGSQYGGARALISGFIIVLPLPAGERAVARALRIPYPVPRSRAAGHQPRIGACFRTHAP